VDNDEIPSLSISQGRSGAIAKCGEYKDAKNNVYRSRRQKEGSSTWKTFPKWRALAFQFKPEQSGNPGGRPKSRQTMKSIYESMLGRPAPIELCRAFHLPAKSTFAQVIAMATVHRGFVRPQP